MLFDGGEIDDHGRTAADGTPDDYLALMQFHELGDYCKPEAGATRVPSARLIGPIKWFEDAEEVFAGDANTRISDDQCDTLGRGLDCHRHVSLTGRIGESIFNDITDDLLQCCLGSPYLLLGAFAQRDLNLVLFRERQKIFHCLSDDI